MMNWLRRFMMGRYGNDALNSALFAACLLGLLLGMVTPFRAAFRMLSVAILFLCYFRMLSRNIQMRYAENQKFLHVWMPFSHKLSVQVKQWKDRKFHRYFKCPSCKTTLRLPRGKGKIEITCPKCKQKFVKKT